MDTFPCEEYHQIAKTGLDTFLFMTEPCAGGRSAGEGDPFVWGNCPKCHTTLVYRLPGDAS